MGIRSGSPQSENSSEFISLSQEPKWGPRLRAGSFSSPVVNGKLRAGRYLLRFAARGSRIRIFKAGLSGAKQYTLEKSSLPQEDSWTCFTLPYVLKKDQKWAEIYLQFLAPRPDKDAWGEVKDVELIKQN